MDVEPSERTRRWHLPSMIIGALIGVIGMVLAIGGGWLVALGGSTYYLLTGVAMIVSGWLLIRQRLAGVWLYVAIVAVTIIWAFWEAGPHGWALVPRVIAPLVLLIAALLVMPTLSRSPHRWRLAL